MSLFRVTPFSASNMDDNEIIDDAICVITAHSQDSFVVRVGGNKWLASGGEDDVALLWNLEHSREFLGPKTNAFRN